MKVSADDYHPHFFYHFFMICVRFTQYNLSIISKNLTNEGQQQNADNTNRKTKIKEIS